MDSQLDNDMRTTPAPKADINLKRFLIGALFLGLIGLGVCIELTRIHYLTHANFSYDSICAINKTVNCETVAQSPFSVFWGVPVAVWGILAYALLVALLAWSLVSPLHVKWPLGLFFIWASGALIASGLLAYISFFSIQSLCLFCAALYMVNGLLFALSLWGLGKQRLSPVVAVSDDVKALLGRPIFLGLLLITAVSAVLSVKLAISPYWHHPGWHELPKLESGVDENGHHWIGALHPLLTIVEFSDYECPFCRKAHKNMRVAAAKYPNEIRLVHRHFPLDPSCNANISRPIHKRACEFAKAVECAAKQNKFWQMSDALFAIQDTTPVADVNLIALAAQIGMEPASFEACMTLPGAFSTIIADIQEGEKKGIEGTPTYFIDDQSFPRGVPEEILKKLLKAAKLKKNR